MDVHINDNVNAPLSVCMNIKQAIYQLHLNVHKNDHINIQMIIHMRKKEYSCNFEGVSPKKMSTISGAQLCLLCDVPYLWLKSALHIIFQV